MPSVNMKFLNVVAIVSAFAVSQARFTVLEKLAINGDARIVDGHPAEKDQFPHQVFLIMVSKTARVTTCGGSLIHNSWVLTAAHCLENKVHIAAHFGLVNTTTPELVLQSKTFLIHPNYVSKTLHNDIGLIWLDRYIPASSSIKPVRLMKRSSVGKDLSEGKIATVSGFGDIIYLFLHSEILNYADLKVITNDECVPYYKPGEIINSTICARGISPPTASTCNGDSGGPLVIREEDGEMTQIGIVSFGSRNGCGSSDPTGYTRPEFYLDWISEYVSDLEIRP